jgi:hypothetical protein
MHSDSSSAKAKSSGSSSAQGKSSGSCGFGSGYTAMHITLIIVKFIHAKFVLLYKLESTVKYAVFRLSHRT